MRSTKGRKGAKIKIGERPVLFLRLKSNRRQCVCEAPLEPNLFLSQPVLSFLAAFSGPYGHQSGTMSLVPGVVYGAIPHPAAYTAVPFGHLWNTSTGWRGDPNPQDIPCSPLPPHSMYESKFGPVHRAEVLGGGKFTGLSRPCHPTTGQLAPPGL